MSYVNDYSAATLLAIGDKDTIAIPETQAIPFYRSIRSQGTDSELRVYKGQGHKMTSDVGVMRDLMLRTIAFAHTHWKTFHPECTYYPTSTSPDPEVTTTGQGGVTEPPTSNGMSTCIISGLVITAMNVLTLTSWQHFRTL